MEVGRETGTGPELPLYPHLHSPSVPPQHPDKQDSQAHLNLPRQGPSREQGGSVPSPLGVWMATEGESSGQQCPDRKGSGTETCRARGPQKPSFP